MSVPIAYQFEWRASIGNVWHHGRGLLSPQVKGGKIDMFQVAVGNLIAAAYPQRGELHLDHKKVYQCPCQKPHTLIWLWRMEITLSTGRDKNTGPPIFGHYVIGLKCEDNEFGVRFMRDGTVKSGMD